MIITVDVYNAAGDRIGESGLQALNASITEALDGAGTVKVSLPLTDERVGALFAVERIVRIYADGTIMGAGIVNQVNVIRSDGGWTLNGSGPDLLNLLQRKSVLRGRVFDAVAINSAVSTLAGLASWSAVCSDTDVVSLRLDGQSVLKALLSVAEALGYHLRAGTAADTVEVGAFGSASGLYVYEAASPGAVDNPDLLLLEEIRVVTDSQDVVNWVEPVGGSGAGEGEQTLAETYAAGSRTSPYTIQTTTGPRGQTVYYLADATSIATYGQIERVGVFKQVTPLSNNETDALRGSEALYDVAAAWLGRYKDPLKTLAIKVVPAQGVNHALIRVGNKVRVTYKGVVETDDGLYTYLDVDSDYWIMRVTKSLTLTGIGYSLEVASVDRVAQDATEIVVGALESLTLQGVSVKQYLNHYNFTYEEEVATGHDAVIPLDVTAVTRTVSRVLLRLTSRPFRTTVTGASAGGGSTSSSGGGGTSAGGGDHNHRVLALTSFSGFPFVSDQPYLGRESDGGSFSYFRIASNAADLWTESSSGSHTHTISNHTHTIPDHTHPLTYGITDDTTYPADIEVWVNGTDRTAALGGPWGTTSTGIDEELDLTTYITGAATLRQRHTITIKCGSGQGVVQGNIDVQETITGVDVSL